MYKAGSAKVDITILVNKAGLMGYGRPWNKAKAIETPIFARAFVFEDEKGNRLAYVSAEIAFPATELVTAVVKDLEQHHSKLGFNKNNVWVSATHTHSAPGGYFHYPMYNFTIPGFVPQVFNAYKKGISQAIRLAAVDLKPVSIKSAKGSFTEEDDVAFNRSLAAYNANPEVKEKLKEGQEHLAVNREMTLWRLEDEDGEPSGAINWFGVHPTSIHNDNKKICSDNKGYAAKFQEEAHADKYGFLSVFAQNACGDVSPNYVWDTRKQWTRGKFKNDFSSARHNGKLQADLAEKLLEEAKVATPISGEIETVTWFVDWSDVEVLPKFSNGKKNAKTGPSVHGVAFFEGTVEGPGMPKLLANFAKRVLQGVKREEMATKDPKIIEKYRIHGPKYQLIESSKDATLMGRSDISRIPLPGIADAGLMSMKRNHRNGSLQDRPWIPQVLPIQIAILGNIAWLGLPCEITTIAAQRLRKNVLKTLKARGVEEVMLHSYTGGYCGYITTFEEYQLQAYEGGHTVFGQWTLGAFQTKFNELAEWLLLPKKERPKLKHAKPVEFPEEILAKRTFPEN